MEESFISDLFDKEFRFIDQSNVRLDLHHQKAVPETKSFTCNMCGKEFSLRSTLVNHMRTHTGERPFKCTVEGCRMAFKTEKTLGNHNTHKHSDERLFKCEFLGCSFTTKTAANLSQHKHGHSDERPFACPNVGCQFRSKSKSNIAAHAKCVHNSAKTFECFQCDYKTARKYNLKLHLHRHSSRRDFKCNYPQCKASFKTSSYLKNHFSKLHGEKSVHAKTFECFQCDYKTARKYNLKLHLHRHSSRRDFKCNYPQCKASFKTSSYLKNHFSKLHGEKNVQCDRPACGQFVATQEALMKHLKLHNSTERAFQCPLCFQHFVKLQHLQEHCVLHTNEKPFQCGHCEYAASKQCRVKAHISTIHASIPFPFIVHLLDDRECLRCKVTLPSAEFGVHYRDQHHVDPKMIN